MEPSARLLIVDGAVGPPNEDPLTKFLDLMMLVSAGGRERTALEWSSMLDAAGFRLDAVVPAGLGCPFSTRHQRADPLPGPDEAPVRDDDG